MNEYTDNEIIECLRNRQSYVVHYLSDRYLPVIRLMVTQMGGTPEDAKDMFQEGLIIMLEKIDDRHFALTCKFKTLLFCICEKLWKAALAKRYSAANYFRRRTDEEADEDFTENPDREQREEVFRDAYDSLDEAGRAILKLYWEEVDPREIAEKLGYSYGYVRKKKCKAQAQLIEKVKNHPHFRMLAETR